MHCTECRNFGCLNVFQYTMIILMHSPFHFRCSLILYSFWRETKKSIPKLKILFILFMEHLPLYIVRGGIIAFEKCEVGNECRHNAHERQNKNTCVCDFSSGFSEQRRRQKMPIFMKMDCMLRCHCLRAHVYVAKESVASASVFLLMIRWKQMHIYSLNVLYFGAFSPGTQQHFFLHFWTCHRISVDYKSMVFYRSVFKI